MIPLVKKLVTALLWDEQAALRWVRGFFGFVAGVAASTAPEVLKGGWEVVSTWSLREWLGRWAVGLLTAIPVMILAGQKNQSPEAIRAIAHSLPGQTPVPPPGA